MHEWEVPIPSPVVPIYDVAALVQVRSDEISHYLYFRIWALPYTPPLPHETREENDEVAELVGEEAGAQQVDGFEASDKGRVDVMEFGVVESRSDEHDVWDRLPQLLVLVEILLQ